MSSPHHASGVRAAGGPALAAWHELAAQGGERVVRVVVLADSMGDTSFGFRAVWNRLHDSMTLSSPGTWFPPRTMDGLFAWGRLPGVPAEIGIDGRGQLLVAGDGPAGVALPAVVPTTIDLYYTARPDGAPLEVRVDGEVVGVVDTACNELGDPVPEPVMAQRWRSPYLGRMVVWEVEAVGPTTSPRAGGDGTTRRPASQP